MPAIGVDAGHNSLTYTQMTRNRTSLRGSQPGSGESEDESADAQSSGKEQKTPSRGRKAQALTNPEDVEMVGAKS